MTLAFLDWVVVGVFFAVTLGIGWWAARRAKSSPEDYFLSGREMPWWLLGVSMVATTFAADTPNFVTQQVRENGVSGNWVWWSFILGSMATVFIFARLWRRSHVVTDVELYELRYGGKPAAFLRGFRALYLGIIFNVLVMGNVCLAGVKFGEIVLGIDGWVMLSGSGVIVLFYSVLGGLRGILFTDLFQFFFALGGAILAAILLVGHSDVGGWEAMLSNELVQEKMNIFPDMSDASVWVPMLFIPLAVQWWGSSYPGAEPGGGGYVVQRMLAAKDESHSMRAVLLFYFAHYVLRPWPWIVVGLASLVAFPTLAEMQAAFPGMSAEFVKDDAAYPAMLTLLPRGILGLVAASLIAAFMSTMSTQVNLGASYFVNDLYKRFFKPEASAKHLIVVARVVTVVMVVLASISGLVLESADQAFQYMLLLTAGSGGVLILRWFWWRISAYTEIVAMVGSLVVAAVLAFGVDFPETAAGNAERICWGVGVTTLLWLGSVFITPGTEKRTLEAFYRLTRPGGPGWGPVKEGMKNVPEQPDSLGVGVSCAFLGSLAMVLSLVGIGYGVYGEVVVAGGCLLGALGFGGGTWWFWRRGEG